MLVIVNPYATTVSDRLKNLVVYALEGRYDVTAVSTEARAHAIEIGREARVGEYDIVVAFGGDGTLNEVANGLAGTSVPVSVLPGGSTNVVCRTLGIPNDVVDAAEHLLGLADDFAPRRIDLGVVNGRRFVFACGAGLDAAVVQRVDAHPRLKERAREWYFTWAAVSAFYRRYLRDPVVMRLEVDGELAEGIDDRAELGSVQLLSRPAVARLRGRDARQQDTGGGDAEAGGPARRPDGRDPGALGAFPGLPTTARSITSRTSSRRGSNRSRATARTRSGRSRSRSTATTSATTPSSTSRSSRARSRSSRDYRRSRLPLLRDRRR